MRSGKTPMNIFSSIYSFFSKKNAPDYGKLLKKTLERNHAVIESLRDYDTGKKDISTRAVERHFPGVRTSR